ncbi:hypothetical protein NAEX_05108 [Nannocystis exedens]|nr:hypothetical protein NAEX_05108 [Nannocystis exedens]
MQAIDRGRVARSEIGDVEQALLPYGGLEP